MKNTHIIILLSGMTMPMLIFANNVGNIVLADVWINGVDRNTDALYFQIDQEIYVECQVLAKLNLQSELFEKNSQKNDFCLMSKAPTQAQFDEGLQAIKLTIPATFFVGGDYDHVSRMPNKANFGAFANYQTFYERDSNLKDFSALSEVGVFKDYWLFKNAFLYRDHTSYDHLVRVSSSLDIEFPKHFTNLTLGDNTSVSNSLMSSFRFGGLSFGTNYTDRPDFIYWNSPTLKGSAVLPSTVDLFINGVNIYQQKVLPGNYTLQSGANIQQAGDAQIVVEDILGNRTVQNFPIYINNRLLKKGLNEYNISLGKIRYNYNDLSDDYREFFTNIYFRRGVLSSTTLGMNVGYSDDIKNLSLLWTQSIGKLALLDLSYARSQYNGEQGDSIGFSMSRNFGYVSFGASSKYSSQNYRALGYLDQIANPKLDSLAYISLFKVPYFNSLSLNYVERRYYQNQQNFQDNKILNISVSKMLSRRASFSASYFKDFQDNSNSGINFSVSFYLDRNRNIYFDHTTDNQNRINYVKSSTTQNGFDYAIGVGQRDDHFSYNAYGLWKTDVGDLSIAQNQTTGYHNTQLSYRGALVWLDGKFAMTRYVDNAFALVKVGDYPDIDVYRSLSLVGHTQKDGYIFVHSIIPYVTYDLSFDQDQLPIEDKIDYSNQKVIALNQRGYSFKYPIYHTQRVVVHLVDKEHKNFVQGTEVYVDQDREQYFPIDKEGKVYLYGLMPKSYSLLVKTVGGKTCNSQLNVVANLKNNDQVVHLICH